MDCCSDNGGTGTFNFLIISWLILGCPPPNDDNSNSDSDNNTTDTNDN